MFQSPGLGIFGAKGFYLSRPGPGARSQGGSGGSVEPPFQGAGSEYLIK